MLSKNKDALNMIDRFLQAAAEEIEELCIEENDYKTYVEKLNQLKYSMEHLNKAWDWFNSAINETRHDENIVKPNRYKGKDGKDLLQLFEESLLTDEEYKGFLKGNVYKYVKRYEVKNGKEDLKKATVYLNKLYDFEVQHEKEKQVH